MTLDSLRADGFDIDSRNHAEAIMARDFPQALAELCQVLRSVNINDGELVSGGGGEAQPTQRLRRAFTGAGWVKRTISVRKLVDDIAEAAPKRREGGRIVRRGVGQGLR